MRGDPQALAPETLLVFELKGALSAFAQAISKVRGLELIDEEELAEDGDDTPTLYMMVPNRVALRQIVSLWDRWQSGQQDLGTGFAPWRDAFALLRNIRRWDASDRVAPGDRRFLEEDVEFADPSGTIDLEIELVFRKGENDAARDLAELRAALAAAGGSILSVSRIPEIAYHAIAARLPVPQVRALLEARGIATVNSVMHIRPQSVATELNIADPAPSTPTRSPLPDQPPILAVFDGYPMTGHRLLRDRMIVEDIFDLEEDALVQNRVHGTAMASLIIHGDRNREDAALPRPIHFVPMISSQVGREQFPAGSLVVDMVYRAVLALRGEGGSAPHVLIINISLGNSRRPFHGRMSAWARMLDRLAYTYGILFVVSAGNQIEPFAINTFSTRTEFEEALAPLRATQVKHAVGAEMRNRRIFSPAETINGLTVGSCNMDFVAPHDRRASRANIDPYGDLKTANPSSSLGPGFADATKPDVIMNGGREHLRVTSSGGGIVVEPCGPTRQHGLKVAAPPAGGREDSDGFTDGTSAAAALVSRTGHRVHDALQAIYGDSFTRLPVQQRAALLKALLVHSAQWPVDGAALIKSTLGPPDSRQHVRQKDNIRRFLGYGLVDPDLAISCTSDRATFWATGTISADREQTISIPIPAVFGGRAVPHHLRATLAWFTPTLPGRQTYRTVRLRVLKPDDLGALRIDPAKGQPDENQTARGTVFTRCWEGVRAAVLRETMFADLIVQRQPHIGQPIDEPVAYGLAVTLAMPGVEQVYEQARQQLEERVRPRPRP